MNDGFRVKLTGQTAAELCGRFELSDSARLLLRADHTPRQYLDLLVEGRHHLDAERVLAHALPKPEAVWWAIQCARLAHGASPAAAVQGALRAAETWVVDPSDANRRAAMPAAEAAGIGTPAGCAAVAAYFSGGSLAPPGIADVPPGEHLTAQCVAGSVLMSAVLTEPQHAEEKHRRYLTLGLQIIDGGHRVPAAPRAGQETMADGDPDSQLPKPRSSLFF